MYIFFGYLIVVLSLPSSVYQSGNIKVLDCCLPLAVTNGRVRVFFSKWGNIIYDM